MTDTLTLVLGYVIYTAQGCTALWGTYCLVVLWRRLRETSFRNEEAMEQFMAEITPPLVRGDFATVSQMCQLDRRAVPQLIRLAIDNRQLGYAKMRQWVAERFQRDVLADFEYRMNWIQTVIRSAPMLGLFGTVGGMMGAFEKLGHGQKVEVQTSLAGDISLALVTTVVGLAIAIPLILCTANITLRIRRLEDLTETALSRFFEIMKPMFGVTQQR